MLFSSVASVIAVATLAPLPYVQAETGLTDAQVAILVQRLADVTSHSWEYGTQAQTLIELDTPSYSVYNNSELPPSRVAPASFDAVTNIITKIVQDRNQKIEEQNLSGPQPFFPLEGSSADPVSVGVAALIANHTGKSTRDVDFGQAAKDQLAFLESSQVPKTPDGAISHRREEAQLWNDFIYMVPPFLAYYGVLTDNQTLVWEAYNQISLYRKYLRDTSAGGLWKHVLLGSWNDQGYWSTGHGWAAAGALRVIGTIKNSKYSEELSLETQDLANWVTEIHDAIYPYLREDGLFHNYANNPSTFPDAASAALVAATVYRHALLTNTYKHIHNAEFVRRKLWAPKSGEGNDFTDPNSFRDMVHFTSDGYLTPVVNPNDFSQEGEKSPEGQAFTIQLYTAWQDWVANGSLGEDRNEDVKRCSFGPQRSRMRRVVRGFNHG